MSLFGQKVERHQKSHVRSSSCRIIVSGNIVQGGTQSRQNYIPRNADPKGGGAQGVIPGAETGGEYTSSADRYAEEEAGRIIGDPPQENKE